MVLSKNSFVAAFPKLAGQNTNYLVKQMKDVMSGEARFSADYGRTTGW